MSSSDSARGEADEAIEALIELHRGLPREGPGDPAMAEAILDSLVLPPRPRVADLGCGSGAAALLLASRLGGPVVAVDFAEPFLQALATRLRAEGLENRVLPVRADMADPPIAAGSLDLVWSEGAAYAIGFGTALAAWRPLLAPGGCAVVSEMTWFTDTPSEPARAYWSAAYPGMGSEAGNRAIAEAAGWRVLDTRRLPSEAWWTSYYGPLREKLAGMGEPATPAMRAAAREMNEEMTLFAAHADEYGYVFTILAAA